MEEINFPSLACLMSLATVSLTFTYHSSFISALKLTRNGEFFNVPKSLLFFILVRFSKKNWIWNENLCFTDSTLERQWTNSQRGVQTKKYFHIKLCGLRAFFNTTWLAIVIPYDCILRVKQFFSLSVKVCLHFKIVCTRHP